MEERLDISKHKMLRYAEAFKNQDKEDFDKYSGKLYQPEPFRFKKETSPSVSRSTTLSSFHRGWQILRNNTFSHLRGEVNHALEEEIYHV